MFEVCVKMLMAVLWSMCSCVPRNAKRQGLEEFSKDNNIKAESVKKAFKRFQTANKDKSGMIDYTEFCEILQVSLAPRLATQLRRCYMPNLRA